MELDFQGKLRFQIFQLLDRTFVFISGSQSPVASSAYCITKVRGNWKLQFSLAFISLILCTINVLFVFMAFSLMIKAPKQKS